VRELSRVWPACFDLLDNKPVCFEQSTEFITPEAVASEDEWLRRFNCKELERIRHRSRINTMVVEVDHMISDPTGSGDAAQFRQCILRPI
jgi:hypothetical protein